MGTDLAMELGMALGIQSLGRGTVDPTTKALTGNLDVSNGIVLGHREAGIFNSGIDTPTFEREFSEIADIPGHLTPQLSTYLSTLVNGFSFTWQLSGNGIAYAATTGLAKPHPGIDSIFQGVGMVGSNGTDPTYEYAPAPVGQHKYLTAKFWIGDLSFVLMDILVDTLTFTYTPGKPAIVKADFAVGSLESQNDGVVFPTFDFAGMNDVSAPALKDASHTYNTERGFNSATLVISNNAAKVEDCNELSGFRQSPTTRTFTGEEVIWVDAAGSNSIYEIEQLQNAGSGIDPLFFQLGAVAGGGDDLLGVRHVMAYPEIRSVKYEERDNFVVANIAFRGIGTVGSDEFGFVFN